MDDLLHNTTDVAIPLSEIEVAEAGGGLVVVGVRFELEKSSELEVDPAATKTAGHTIVCERLCALITRPMA